MPTLDFPPVFKGGEGVAASMVAERFKERGVSVHVVAPAQPGSAIHDAALPYPVTRIPVAGGTFVTRMPSFYRSAAALVRTFEGDIVYALRPVPDNRHCARVYHLHTTRQGEARGCRVAGAPLATLVNAAFVPFERAAWERADRLIVVSESMRKDVRKVLRSERIPISVIGNGIELERWRPVERQRTRAGKRLLFVGRLDARKGLLRLLEAFDVLASRDSEISLTVIGDGPLRALLDRRIAKSPHASRVRSTGWIDAKDLPGAYHAADLLVVPSDHEDFGLVMLEAMASGLPVVSSDACANLGQPTFARGDSRNLARVVEDIVGDGARLDRMSRQGRETAARLDWDTIADQVVKVFEAVLRGE